MKYLLWWPQSLLSLAKTIPSDQMQLAFLASVFLLSCSSDQSATNRAENESQQQVQGAPTPPEHGQSLLEDCQANLVIATTQREKVEEDLASCQNNLENKSRTLLAIQQEIEELRQTPGAILPQILSKFEQISTTSDVDALLEDCSEFVQRFPKAAETRTVKKIANDLYKTRKRLAKEEDLSKAMAAISEIRKLIENVEDGTSLAITEQVAVATYLKSAYMKYPAIQALPSTNYAESMKDPESERGKSITVQGSIIQISRDGTFFTGLICTNYCSKVYHFITPGETTGVNRGNTASFSGVMVQRYSYSNSGGGTTHSLALVGYFKDQD